MYLMLVLVTCRTTAMYRSSSVLQLKSPTWNQQYGYTIENCFPARGCFVQVRKDEFSAHDVAKR
jgi:hypothetical protein